MSSHTRPVTRLSISIPGTFEDAVDTFETAVPHVNGAEFAAAVERGWGDAAAIAENAPHSFLIYWKNDVRPLMGAAGDTHSAIAYLMGNHVVAERMFRHEPRVMNYAPLRVELSQITGQPVQFSADVPSDNFGSFGIPEVTAVGYELDAHLADLIETIGGTVPQELIDRAPSASEAADG